MSFQWPAALLILIVPWLTAFGRAPRHGDSMPALPRIERGQALRGRIRWRSGTSASPARRRVPRLLALAGACAIVALARPQWGMERGRAHSSAGEVVIAFDLSRSMLAGDARPSRLEQARAYALDMIERMPERRIGLMVFAGGAYLIDPPSSDHAAVLATLPHLMPADLVQQGTDLAAVLDLASDAFTADGTAHSLVLLSDGEAESSAWSNRLAALRRAGVRVFGVGFGTADGALVPGPDGQWLRSSIGVPVKSRLNAGVLAEIAKETGGRYFDGGDAALLKYIAAAPAGKVNGLEQHSEQFMWFLAASLLLLAASCVIEFPAVPKLLSPGPAAHASAALRDSAIAPAALTVAAAALLLLAALHPHYSLASMAEADEEDVDGLGPLEAVVGNIIAKPQIGAAEYLELVHATIRYGDVLRNQSGPVSAGILHDGLEALERGRRLEPRLADWDRLDAALRRLAIPPPALPDDGKPADPANETVAGSRRILQSDGSRDAGKNRKHGESSPGSDADAQRDDSKTEAAATQSLHSVGGSRRRVYDASEWRDPSLVLPLHALDRLRDGDSPAALFRAEQRATVAAPATGVQTW